MATLFERIMEADKGIRPQVPVSGLVDKLPLTATGKLSKLQLRQQFKDYKLRIATRACVRSDAADR